MKKTFATLLILTLVASVCGMLFASAVDPVEELKAKLEALVGADATNAAYDWVIDMEADDNGLVTVKLTVDVVDGKEICYVYGDFYYDPAALTLLNVVADNDADFGMVDCLTSAPSASYENFSVVKPGASGVIELNVFNADENAKGLTGSDSLVLTLKFRLADGVTMTGVYIPTASVEGGEYTYLEDTYLEDLGPTYLSAVNGNGAYDYIYIEEEEESSDVSSAAPSTPEESSEEPSDESSNVPSQPEDSSDESSNVPSQPEDSSEEPDVPSQPEDSSEEPDVPSQPEDSSEEPDVPSQPDESSDVPSQPEESSEEPDESSDVPSQPDESSEESSVASSEASSETESSEPPKPGDSGVLLFAILGLLAIAGAAIAIKARR